MPKAFCLFAAFVFLFETLVWSYTVSSWGDLFLHSEPYRDDAFRFRALVESFDADLKRGIFIMGSSQTREDIDTVLLNEKLSSNSKRVETINLGVSGGWMTELFLQLDVILKKKPEVIVAMPYWRGFYQEYDASKTKSYLFSYGSLRFLAQCYGLRDFYFKYKNFLPGCILANIMPSYRYRSSLIFILAAKWIKGEQRDHPLWFAYKGSQPLEYFDREIAKRKNERLEIGHATIIQKEIFYEFVSRIKRHKIKLVVIDLPWHPRIEELKENYISAWEDYSEFMRTASKDLGFDYVNPNDLPHFSQDEFVSFAYLNRIGREKMTKFMLNLLKTRTLLR